MISARVYTGSITILTIRLLPLIIYCDIDQYWIFIRNEYKNILLASDVEIRE